MAEEAPQPTMTGSARAKFQGMWSSLRSIHVDGDDTDSSKQPSMLEKWTSRRTVSSDDLNNNGTSGTATSALETVVRSMFSSCALGEHDDEEESVKVDTASVSRRDRSKSASRRRGSSSASARAQRAVHNLREKAEQRETSPSYRKGSGSRPASSPNRRPIKHQVPYMVHEVGPPPPPPNAPDLGSATFDDGISAISAHTLEELHRQERLKKPLRFNKVHSDLTQDQGFEQPFKTVSNESSLFLPTTTHPEEEEERDCLASPIEFEREPSNNTFQSMSTESSDFEQVWRQEEQKYWQDAVEKDERKSTPKRGSSRHFHSRDRSRSREQEMIHLKRDGTNTTAGSSAFSVMSASPQHSHPHDTIWFDPVDFVPVPIRSPSRRVMQDPDRIQEFMAIDAHTEIGEI